MGLEPTTFAVTGRRCNRLNYAPASFRLTTESWKLIEAGCDVNERVTNLTMRGALKDGISADHWDFTLTVFLSQGFLHPADHKIIDFLKILLFIERRIHHGTDVDGG